MHVTAGKRMQRQRTRLDIKTLKPLYVLAAILSLVPAYNFETGRTGNGKYLYAILVIGVFSFMPIVSLRERFSSTYPFTPNLTDILLDCGSYICLSLATLVNLLSLRLIHWRKLNKFIKDLQKLDHKYYRHQEDCANRRFTLECYLYFGILILGLGYNEIFWDLAYGFESNWAYFFQNIQKLQLLTTSLLMHNFALAFKYRFECLNRNLSKIKVHLYVKKDLLCPISNGEHKVVKTINENHKALLLLVNDYNEIFGVPIIFVMMMFIFGMLHPINSAILQLIKGNIISGMDDPDFGTHYVSITSLIAASTFTFVIPLASSSHGAIAEAKKTSLIAMSLINSLPIYQYDGSMKSLVGELEVFSNDDTGKYPTFTGRGFYTVNRSVLLILFGAVTTYLIVLIQLNITS